MALDTQVVELLGRQRLISELLRDGLEVAYPARDRGIDLVAYVELSRQVGKFMARPIQMKASTTSAFGVARKYERIADLILAYVWYLDDPARAVTYAMTYPQAEELAGAQGWTSTPSWGPTEGTGGYITNKPSQRLLGLLERYRMTPGQWRLLVTGSLEVGLDHGATSAGEIL